MESYQAPNPRVIHIHIRSASRHLAVKRYQFIVHRQFGEVQYGCVEGEEDVVSSQALGTGDTDEADCKSG